MRPRSQSNETKVPNTRKQRERRTGARSISSKERISNNSIGKCIIRTAKKMGHRIAKTVPNTRLKIRNNLGSYLSNIEKVAFAELPIGVFRFFDAPPNRELKGQTSGVTIETTNSRPSLKSKVQRNGDDLLDGLSDCFESDENDMLAWAANEEHPEKPQLASAEDQVINVFAEKTHRGNVNAQATILKDLDSELDNLFTRASVATWGSKDQKVNSRKWHPSIETPEDPEFLTSSMRQTLRQDPQIAGPPENHSYTTTSMTDGRPDGLPVTLPTSHTVYKSSGTTVVSGLRARAPIHAPAMIEKALVTRRKGEVPASAFSHPNDTGPAHCDMAAELHEINKALFGYEFFREQQLESIISILTGSDTFTILPTGGGKTLVYQVASVFLRKVVVVIMPLISLMNDQYNRSIRAGMNAVVYSNGLDFQSILTSKESMLVFVTPEKLSASASFNNLLSTVYENGRLGFIVVDECHCVSSWGADFRPDYAKLGYLKSRFQVPVLALTGSAPPLVQKDVIIKLGMKHPKVLTRSVTRENIMYEVLYNDNDTQIQATVVSMLQGRFRDQVGIIYCLSRTDCTAYVSVLLRNGIGAAAYHAGLTAKVREKTQRDWMAEKVKIIVATIAFGMGIDKPNVRFVVHVALPKCIESYYQESGRCGRDQLPSTSLLFYNEKQRSTHYWLAMYNSSNGKRDKSREIANLLEMLEFCDNIHECRKVMLMKHFGETVSSSSKINCRSCDNCVNNWNPVYETYSVESAFACVVNLARVLNRHEGRLGLTLIETIKLLKGKKITKAINGISDFAGSLKSVPECVIKRLLLDMLLQGHIGERLVKLPRNSLGIYLYASRELTPKTVKIEHVRIADRASISRIPASHQLQSRSSILAKDLEIDLEVCESVPTMQHCESINRSPDSHRSSLWTSAESELMELGGSSTDIKGVTFDANACNESSVRRVSTGMSTVNDDNCDNLDPDLRMDNLTESTVGSTNAEHMPNMHGLYATNISCDLLDGLDEPLGCQFGTAAEFEMRDSEANIMEGEKPLIEDSTQLPDDSSIFREQLFERLVVLRSKLCEEHRITNPQMICTMHDIVDMASSYPRTVSTKMVSLFVPQFDSEIREFEEICKICSQFI